MNAFEYRNQVLCAESVPLDQLAGEAGTPFYCYSTAQLQQNYRRFAEPLADLNPLVCYAMQANANMAVVRTLVNCGAGVDAASAGELERALSAGAWPDKIVFSGTGKTRHEIMAALLANVRQINVESLPELKLISSMAVQLGLKAPVALRVSSEVAIRTPGKLPAAHKGGKTGIEYEQMGEALLLATTLPGLVFKGLAVHVGNHVYDFEPFRKTFARLAGMVGICRAQGIAVESVNLGGGISIPYDAQKIAPFTTYVSLVRQMIAPLGCRVIFEPGRCLVGDAGILVSRIVEVKQGVAKRFVVLDTGMNDLVRPAMTGTRHSLIPVRQDQGVEVAPVTVVGSIGEARDVFGEDYFLPPLEAGDLVALFQAGAYGSAMSSAYNARPLVPEVMVSRDRHAIIRRRIPVIEQMGWESLPSWMTQSRAA